MEQKRLSVEIGVLVNKPTAFDSNAVGADLEGPHPESVEDSSHGSNVDFINRAAHEQFVENMFSVLEAD